MATRKVEDISAPKNVNSADSSAPAAAAPAAPAPLQTAAVPPRPVAEAVPAQPAGGLVKEPLNPGVLILQWLTYAFWGWTVLGLSFLTTLVIDNLIGTQDTSGVSYAIAAILVLLPISYVTDHFYSKHEPLKKVGAEIWIMVFHAVLFALFAIGSLIGAVIALVLLLTSSDDNQGAVVALVSALIITVYYVLTFMRTLNPAQLHRPVRFYKLVMLLSVGIIAALGIIGPVAKERATRDDRLISDQLSVVTEAIGNYSDKNNHLPSDLQALQLKDDAAKLVSRNLVEYSPEEATDSAANLSGSSDTVSSARCLNLSEDKAYDDSSTSDAYDNYCGSGSNYGTSFRYKLCTTYAKESSDYSAYSSDYSYDSDDDDGYQTDVSAYNHPAGRVCYKLRTNY